MRNLKDLIAKLKAAQAQEPEGGAVLGCSESLNQLEALIPGSGHDSTTEPPEHIKDFVTIRLIAILQTAVRSAVRDIVDEREKLGEELPAVPDKTNITFDMVRDFRKQHYSMGAFYSILLSYSSYEQIDSAFKKVSGDTFEAILNTGVLVDKDNAVLNMVKRGIVAMFERRNALCHEANATDNETPTETLYEWYWITVHTVGSIRRYLSHKYSSKKK